MHPSRLRCFLPGLAILLITAASPAQLRLARIFGDHMVLGIFLGFAVPFVPLPVMLLGTIVILVQAVVFTLLTIVYIAMAVEEHEHHHDEAHAGAH